MEHEKILILDFGSQYTQLIARRVRELNIYSEIHPYNKIPAIDGSWKAVILSGSPYSVRDENAPIPDLSVIKGKLPRGLNGGVRVVLNNRENTIPYLDPKTKKSVKTKTGNLIIKDFTYLTFKKEGKTIAPESDVKKEVMGWIASNAVP